MAKKGSNRFLVALMVFGFVWILGAGCASAPEDPAPSRGTEDVRGDSDRFFQKMEKEEMKK